MPNNDYIKLLQNFLSSHISASDFEADFFRMFRYSRDIDKNVPEPISSLFIDIDAYSDNPNDAIEDPDQFISEEQLRESVRKTLAELQAEKNL